MEKNCVDCEFGEDDNEVQCPILTKALENIDYWTPDGEDLCKQIARNCNKFMPEINADSVRDGSVTKEEK